MKKREIVGVLDNIRSLYNVGSIFRTSDAFGLSKLYLCGITGTPDNELSRKRITKTSLGAEETVPWIYVKQTVDAIIDLKKQGFEILALEQTPSALPITDHSLQTTNHTALIVGHELYGIHEDVLKLADQHIMIPMLGQKESLNVSVAFGIACAQLKMLKAD